MDDDKFREGALEYHRSPVPGKISVTATKPLSNQRDLALAYSPGVAAACELIVDDPDEAAQMTARGNLVGVVTNGTAVLGLGPIGPLASKPVMEGKGVLFKKFAGIDVFDIELDELDPDKLVDIVAALEPTFGGINLEDIKAPECFIVESKLRERMGIPVFHDDQHGTAIIAGAAVTNGLRVVGKSFDQVKLVASGAGAAALACLDMLVTLGLKKENIIVTDIAGVVYEGRTEQMDPYKARYAVKTAARSLNDAIDGADIFLGLSAPRVLKPEMVKKMADRPLILALANPEPEILPELARAARPDAIIATGRSDYPNQVNNVLCFPFIFRGALDVGATTINEEMKKACVNALADLAMAEADERVSIAYPGQELKFGPEFLIPKPFDPRLISHVAPAVARAAMETGVARRPIKDFKAYEERLERFVFRTGMVMKPVFDKARQDPRSVIYGEGEEDRVLRAVQVLIDDGLAKPILIGRREIIADKVQDLGLRYSLEDDVDILELPRDPRLESLAQLYHDLMQREGVSPDLAASMVRGRPSLVAALMVKSGEADAMVCGTTGRYQRHLNHVMDVIGLAPGVNEASAINLLITPKGNLFICDTNVTPDPTAEQVAEMTLLAANAVRHFGVEPKAALLSHSNFGSGRTPSAEKMREALRLLHEMAPDLEVEGEMHSDSALSQTIRERIFPNSRLKGRANLLVMPTLDAANIAYNLVKMLADGLPVGPILIGVDRPAHILTPSATVRGVVNISALAVVGAQEAE
ncbi:NADP-dependent malic enzyme [Magnetospira sp. QH-2]|uniref:NADP-dependent malic enzyme n=1 Tax=Magnetospira sp. (strain QH-2) TaxID=1288970 RepID=UPI0003E81A40|nr:NADP-dependent malic enzyme [Magnetospira sp. QH-2]CCQ74047.1 NAD-dependent malic enzyme [Magnetospira sp. QH-2]